MMLKKKVTKNNAITEIIYTFTALL